ncbi:hypothetical protein FACS1894102_5950 [Spirochaetia bacterium]|nr:hypothetical protein FACS1894102_5950 [Spirochaetia bacterium]
MLNILKKTFWFFVKLITYFLKHIGVKGASDLGNYASRKLKSEQITNADKDRYIDYILHHQYEKSEFVSLSSKQYIRKENDPKLIAFYLPQFYQIPLNDQWYGTGFTERK